MTRSSLVIGGTRNLGPDMVLALLAQGDRVAVLNRGLTPGELPGNVERLTADRSDQAALAAALRGRSFDRVVDTTLYTGADAAAVARLLEGRCGRYVFWSTGQVYLVRSGPRPPFVEGDYEGPLMAEPPAADKVNHDNWVYGVDKRAAEEALREAQARCSFSYVSLRMPMINSPRDHYGRLAGVVRRLLDGGPLLVPDDQDSLSLRHVFGADVIAATLRAADPAVPAGTCVNVAQDETVKLEEMLAIVSAALGKTALVVKVPRAALESRDLLPACAPWSGRWMSVLDNKLSKQMLGMRYTPLGEYLPRLVEVARGIPPEAVPGYERRAEERELAGA